MKPSATPVEMTVDIRETDFYQEEKYLGHK